ncbi:MAG: rod shape-determining protein MreC [bacterium]|nr:MAG: rod shape-determining protein MreC [bacterium]
MRDFLTRHREGLLFLILVLVSFLLISHQVKDRYGMTYLRRGSVAVISPFQSGTAYVSRALSGVWKDYIYLLGVRTENRTLKEEVSRLRSEVQTLRDELEKAGSLFQYSKYLAETGYAGVTGRVIGESPDPWSRTVFINRGSADGIRTGMPAVTPEGLAGRVIEVTDRSALVRLIVDRSSQVPVMVNRSRSRAILEGEGSGTCRLKYLSRTEDIKEGDVVITSGLAGVFPRGIEVGRVTEVLKKNYGLYQYAKLLPEAPVGRLEDVIILTGREKFRDGR